MNPKPESSVAAKRCRPHPRRLVGLGFRGGNNEAANEIRGYNRRAFIRAALLTGLGWLGVKLMFRKCSGRAGCGGCGEFGRCSLPWKEAKR